MESAYQVKQSAEEGKLQEKTKEKATNASQMLGSIGSSLFKRVDSFMNDVPKPPRGDQYSENQYHDPYQYA